jgi:heme-degrading monooxygenase HmoA
MPIVLKRTATKPSTVSWPHEDPTLSEPYNTYKEWIRNLPGVLSHSGEARDENTFVMTTVFLDEDAFDSFKKARADNPYTKVREAHATERGITVTIQTRTI